MKPRADAALESVLALVRRGARGPVYMVGGSVRDALLRRPTHDLDLAVGGSAEELGRRLARELKGTLVTLDDATKVFRVVVPASAKLGTWSQIDIAEIQGRDIHEDLLRRDFTINAMAWPVHPEAGGLLDPRGGRRDLKAGLVRADRPSVFDDDPLRLLRAFRQAAELGFRVDPATLKQIRARRKSATRPAGERIRQELLGVLGSPDCSRWLRRMDEAGLLTELFPELEDCRRCAQAYYGRGGVLRHSLDAAARMDFLLENLAAVFPRVAKDLRAQGALERAAPLLRLAALLHDIAKPATAKKIDGRLRFFDHDVLGARKAAKLLGRLRFSNDEISLVCACVLHHLRPGNLAANDAISDKAAFRFFRDVGSHGVPLLLVCWSDHASYLSPASLQRVLRHASKDPHGFPLRRFRGEAVRKTLHHLQVVGFLLHSYFRRRERILPARLLDGREVMKALGIPPGPDVGRLLGLLQEAQAEGTVRNRAQALKFIKKPGLFSRS